MCADMANEADSFAKEEILEGGDKEVRIGAKVFLCEYEVEERYLSAITDMTWVTGTSKRS